ncbi:sulfite reductase beta subunit-like hemoprotein [Microbacterium testaceum]|nr:hypothetical protein [Microbacterium testaceum]MDQ1174657.1 sulfite reductase beta subunit-like hemoprotein [Microbacterium testaceum]
MTVPTQRSAPTTSATVCVVMPFCTAAMAPSSARYGSMRAEAHRAS